MTRLLLLLFLFAPAARAADKPETAPLPKKAIDLTGYKTVKEAVKADAKAFPAGGKALGLGYLGLSLADGKAGKPVVEDVEAESPADKAGLKVDDTIVAIDGTGHATASAARDKLRGRFAGDSVKFLVTRAGQTFELTAKYDALSKPMSATPEQRAILGIQVEPPKASGGIEVTRVTTGGGADKAGVKVGDIIMRVNDTKLTTESSLQESLSDKKPGDLVKLLVQRGKEELNLQATLISNAPTVTTAGWDDRLPTNFRKPVYKLAIVGVEYTDAKHSETIQGKDWENALFSKGTYTEKNASGSTVYGSLADYYRELSYDTLKVEGKFMGWFEVSKKKMDYNLGSSTTTSDKSKFFAEMMDKVTAKLGKDPLKDYDGIFIVFAGDGVQTSRGGLYWPHRARFTHDKKQYNYFIVPEARRGKMTDISVICHEFGHMLGLPDLYARPENPGSEGVGVWDAMSNQLPNGRPQHFSAWSKEQMGWIKPVPIDPRVKQKLVLNPIEDSPSDCLKVIVRADGSEYFLLENRQRKGWDKDLPADGLLIWRVLPGQRGTQQVYLEEAHGVEGPSGPRVFAGAVPFPSPANRAFTPFTTPSSKSQLGGGLDVNITNIRRLPDGRITLHIGYDYQ
ncbi:hypothetical protein BH11PLA2_BH11PLA2_21580 [soil metagenome]